MESSRIDARRPFAADALYKRDFFTWTQRQAELIRRGLFGDLDVYNLIEELETLGRSEAAARIGLSPDLHGSAQTDAPARASRIWTRTITRERPHVARLIRDNPGLKTRSNELFESAYADARKEVAGGTAMPLKPVPEHAPFTLAQALDEGFWAGAPPPAS